MVPPAFVCDAIYYGTQLVKGAVSPSMLSSLAELVLNSHNGIQEYRDPVVEKLPRGERCQLQIDDEKLKVSCIKKDEGFESDSESSTASSEVSIGERLCTSHEIKVIQDHVLRLEKLIRQDSGFQSNYSQPDDGGMSLSSSSGAESEEESSKNGHYGPKCSRSIYADPTPQVEAGVSVGLRKSSSSSLFEKDIRNIQSDSGSIDSILVSDILFCHVLSHRPKVVIVVVKSIESSLIHAYVFECLSHEAARTLYSNFHIASNKYKLNRYRNSRRRNDGLIGPGDKATLDRIHVSIRNIRRRSYESLSSDGQDKDESSSKAAKESNMPPRSFHFGEFDEQLYKADNSNINIIEIRDTDPHNDPFSMMHRVDSNGVTHIEIESAPCSLVVPPSPIRQPTSKSNYEPNDILSALDRLSLHSAKNPDSYLNAVGVTGSCPNSILSASREILAAERERKSRQRQPPLYISEEQTKKNTNSLPRKDTSKKRSDRRNRSKSSDRREEKERKNSWEDIHKTPPTKNQRVSEYEASPSQKLEPKFLHELEANLQERQSRSRNPRSREAQRPHNKGPAPPPPPRRHPTNPSLILVPTKSGHENNKSYYPKESHITRGNKYIRIDYPVYPPWNINADINNNPQRIYYGPPGWMGPHEFHSSRISDPIFSNEVRRRSRSKSPARRPMAYRYIDAMSTLNLSQKLKGLSDTVKQTLKNSPAAAAQIVNRDGFMRNNERKSKNNLLSIPANTDETLRPVMKRGKKVDNSRRVTFSAYATVQVMES